MTRYRRIETGTLTDQKVAELSRPAPNGQTLWQYLITGKRTTPFPGLVVAKEVEIASDLGWPIMVDLFTEIPENGCRCLRDAWDEIESRGMVVPDWVSGVIVLPRALLDRRGEARVSAKPTSPNDFRGWAKWWDEIPDCDLKAWYLAELGRFAGALDRATERSKKPDAYLVAYRESFATPLQRVGDAYPDAYATRHPIRRDDESSRSVNASSTRRRPTRVPVPVPEDRASGPDQGGQGLSFSGAPDPDMGRPRDLVQRSEVSRADIRARGLVVPQDHALESPRSARPEIVGDPRGDERKRLLRVLAALHVEVFNRVRDELGAQVPHMQPVGDPAERSLTALVQAQVTLEGFEGVARHVLAVREAEARRKRTVKFLGQTVWHPDSFGIAKAMEVGEDRRADTGPLAQRGQLDVLDDIQRELDEKRRGSR